MIINYSNDGTIFEAYLRFCWMPQNKNGRNPSYERSQPSWC